MYSITVHTRRHTKYSLERGDKLDAMLTAAQIAASGLAAVKDERFIVVSPMAIDTVYVEAASSDAEPITEEDFVSLEGVGDFSFLVKMVFGKEIIEKK